MDVRDHIIWACAIGVVLVVLCIGIYKYNYRVKELTQKVVDTQQQQFGFLEQPNDQLTVGAVGEVGTVGAVGAKTSSPVHERWCEVEKLIDQFSKTNTEVVGEVTQIYKTLNVIHVQEKRMKINNTSSWGPLREAISGSARAKDRCERLLSKWRQYLHKIPHEHIGTQEQMKSMDKLRDLSNDIKLELPKLQATLSQLTGVHKTLKEAEHSYFKILSMNEGETRPKEIEGH
jgi:hypothetical protein